MREREGGKEGRGVRKKDVGKSERVLDERKDYMNSIYLKLSAGDLELKVNSEGVEGMERLDTAPGLGGS